MIKTEIICPTENETIKELHKRAQLEKENVIIWGGGTHVPKKKSFYCLDMTGFTGPVELDKYNMSILSPAGNSIADLRTMVNNVGLDLPFDPPNQLRSTIGGVVAANNQGPWRWGRRPLRDHILGLNIILPNGKEVMAGGNTIKNVAGFDFGKLMIGSYGTLGVITSVIIKLMPLPECRLVGEIIGHSKELGEIALGLRDGKINPAALLFVKADGHNFSRLIVGFEGGKEKVKRQWQAAEKQVKLKGLNLEAKQNVDLIDNMWEKAANQTEVRVRAEFLPSFWLGFEKKLREWSICADLGVGVCRLWRKESNDEDLQTLNKAIKEIKGWMVVENGTSYDYHFPLGYYEEKWLKKLKTIIDPAGILNSGCLGAV